MSVTHHELYGFDPDRYEWGMNIYRESEYALEELTRLRKKMKELQEARENENGREVR